MDAVKSDRVTDQERSNCPVGNDTYPVGPPKSHLELSEAFREIDDNGDGRIDFPQFVRLLASLHVSMSRRRLIDAFRRIDGDGNSSVDFREFLSWWRAAASG
jgi:Ca2+-binding EF-hand superfamily protein